MRQNYSVLLIKSMLIAALLSTGCSPSARSPSSAANISGINHVAGQTVNSFTVNGYGGSLTGNSCCIMLPDMWQAGLTASIKWESDPNANEPIPMKKNGLVMMSLHTQSMLKNINSTPQSSKFQNMTRHAA
ncbi:DUF3304 domain-containing protein [Klebsiella aerogenes]